jgi:hypothetical protein
MTLTGISNRGLLLIAVLVGLLWGCILTERAIVRRASQQTEQFLRGPAHPYPASDRSGHLKDRPSYPVVGLARASTWPG